MRKIWDIPGGIHPAENKLQSLKTPLAEAALPSRVVLPLMMHIGQPAEAVVAVGDTVLTGQLVGKPIGPISAAVHASISGTVTAIEALPVPHPSGLNATCIVIESDGNDEHIEYSPVEDYTQLEPKDIAERIQQAGLAGMGGAGFPTSAKLNPTRAPSHPIDTLILNGTECEPYITADHTLMLEKPESIVRGMQLLAYVLGEPKHLLIGVEDNKPDAIKALQAATEGTPIEVVSFPTKYPSGGEKQLIQILTGKEVPSGGLPSDHGIVMQNIGTAVAAWDAIHTGQPLISRITTLVGEALEHQGNLQVRIGTPIEELLSQMGYDEAKADRVVMGGPMMGFAVPDVSAPVTKITNCLLVPTKKELPPPPPAQSCIRCGLCAEACPASLLPQQLFWYSQSQDHTKLKDYNLFDCIECGACAYVCPSNIPLVQYYRASKGEIRQEQIERQQSDHARERFEARQRRLEKEAEEREAKRQARLAAAKQKQAETADQDIVAQAMARVANTHAEPSDSLDKLKRQQQTNLQRLENMREKADAADSDEQKAKFLAQIKNTEKRLAGIEEELAALSAGNSDSGSEMSPATGQSDASEDSPELDAASIAIAKAKSRAAATAAMSDRDKQVAKIDSLVARLAKSEVKLLAATNDTEGSTQVIDALRSACDNLTTKISDAKQVLAEMPEDDSKSPSNDNEDATQDKASQEAPELDAASIAIAKAKSRAAAAANMSPRGKQIAKIDSLVARLAKSEAKLLAASHSEDDDSALMIDTLRSARDNLATKISEAQQVLAEMPDDDTDATHTQASTHNQGSSR